MICEMYIYIRRCIRKSLISHRVVVINGKQVDGRKTKQWLLSCNALQPFREKSSTSVIFHLKRRITLINIAPNWKSIVRLSH